MIRRTLDAAYVNSLANHPLIRPFVGGDGQSTLDLGPLISDRQNVFLTGLHGGFCYSWTAPRTYEIHTFILPEGRGKAAYALARESLDWMRGHGAAFLWTRVDPTMANVRRFTLAAGLTPDGTHSADYGAGPVVYDLFSWRKPCP